MRWRLIALVLLAACGKPADADSTTGDSLAPVRPVMESACAPCVSAADCATDGGACFRFHVNSFCTRKCNTDNDCPENFSCKNTVCQPDSGACLCSDWAVSHAAKGTCATQFGAGWCVGRTVCATVGELPECDQRVPLPETCNDRDDDCNGITDDGTASKECADNDACTRDDCNGGCSHSPQVGAWCMDDEPCTTGVCDAGGKCLSYALLDCPGSGCAAEWCDFGVGCTSATLECDDGNACTGDSCVGGGCTFSPASGVCDDGDVCSSGEFCENGECLATPFNCSDDVTCTVDGCLRGFGCFHRDNCDDSNGCTIDGCDKLLGCVHVPGTGACTDDDLCTSGESCMGGTCQGGVPVVCSDGGPCSTESCDSFSGCSYVPVTGAASCVDGCGKIVLCAGGKCPACKPPIPVICDDANECTTDTDSPTCSHMPVADGMACTSGCGLPATCVAGVCQATSGEVLGTRKLDVIGGFSGNVRIDADGTSIWAAGNAGMSGTLTVLHLDTTAKPIWQQQFPLVNTPTVLTVLALGQGVLIGGSEFALNPQLQSKQTNAWVARVDANGTALWHRSFSGNPLSAEPSVVAMDADDAGFLLGGSQKMGTTSRALLLRTDGDGHLLWRRDFSLHQQEISAIRRVTDGILVGGGWSEGAKKRLQPWLAKLDLNGATLWEIKLPNPANEDRQIRSLAPLANGSVLAAGQAPAGLAFVLQVTADGKLVWHRPLPGTRALATTPALLLTAVVDGSSVLQVQTGPNAPAEFFGTELLYLTPAGEIAERHHAPAFLTPGFLTYAARPGRLISAQSSDSGLVLAESDAWGHTACSESGPCVDLTAAACADGDPCTLDSCDSNHGGCWHSALGSSPACDDGGPCTIDSCSAGLCTHTPVSDGAPCAAPCLGVCAQGGCAIAAGTGQIVLQNSVGNLERTPEGILTRLVGNNVAVLNLQGEMVRQLSVNANLGDGMLVERVLFLPQTQQIAVSASGLYQIDPLGHARVVEAINPQHMEHLGDGFMTATGLAGSASQIAAWDAQFHKKWAVQLPIASAYDYALMQTSSGGVAVYYQNNFSQLTIQRFTQTGILLPPVYLAQGSWHSFPVGDDIALLTTCPQQPGTCLLREHAGTVLWTRPLLVQGKPTELIGRGDGTALLIAVKSISAVDGEGSLLWTVENSLNLSSLDRPVFAQTPDAIIWRDAIGTLHFTDAWLNATCDKSGPCLGKKTSDCSDENPCTYDRCDAEHGGCWHPVVTDGSACGKGTCQKGICSGG